MDQAFLFGEVAEELSVALKRKGLRHSICSTITEAVKKRMHLQICLQMYFLVLDLPVLILTRIMHREENHSSSPFSI